jgi:hypothetical protein
MGSFDDSMDRVPFVTADSEAQTPQDRNPGILISTQSASFAPLTCEQCQKVYDDQRSLRFVFYC